MDINNDSEVHARMRIELKIATPRRELSLPRPKALRRRAN